MLVEWGLQYYRNVKWYNDLRNWGISRILEGEGGLTPEYWVASSGRRNFGGDRGELNGNLGRLTTGFWRPQNDSGMNDYDEGGLFLDWHLW